MKIKRKVKVKGHKVTEAKSKSNDTVHKVTILLFCVELGPTFLDEDGFFESRIDFVLFLGEHITSTRAVPPPQLMRCSCTVEPRPEVVYP